MGRIFTLPSASQTPPLLGEVTLRESFLRLIIYKICDIEYNKWEYFIEKEGKRLKFAAIIIAILILLCIIPKEEPTVPAGEPVPEVQLPEEQKKEEEPLPAKIEYEFPECKIPEAAVYNYLNALYESYISMLPVDISEVIDTDFEMMANVQTWSNLLAMRRSIISENDYCYVETERFPFLIHYIDERELDDRRMDYVDTDDFGEGAEILHFVIKGEEGKAYPPIFAANSQHSVVLTFEDGVYKIAYHYFPGSEGKFQNDLPATMMERAEMEELLEEEFAEIAPFSTPSPEGKTIYDPEKAVAYALEYCEKQNPAFHFVGDWYGNCMNFASQCVWSGLRDENDTPRNYGSMTRDWYCGKPGGTMVWASVSRFWNWISEEKCDMQILRFYNVTAARKGDIVNIGSYLCETENKYTHALFVVDEEKMMLAQNSPACFVYYSDLVNNYARFIRPISLKT